MQEYSFGGERGAELIEQLRVIEQELLAALQASRNVLLFDKEWRNVGEKSRRAMMIGALVEFADAMKSTIVEKQLKTGRIGFTAQLADALATRIVDVTWEFQSFFGFTTEELRAELDRILRSTATDEENETLFRLAELATGGPPKIGKRPPNPMDGLATESSATGLWVEGLIPNDCTDRTEERRRMRSAYGRLLRLISNARDQASETEEDRLFFNELLRSRLNRMGTKMCRYCFQLVLRACSKTGRSDEAFKRYVRETCNVIIRESERLYSEYQFCDPREWRRELNDPEPAPWDPPPWRSKILTPFWPMTMEQEAWGLYLNAISSEDDWTGGAEDEKGTTADAKEISRRDSVDVYIAEVLRETGRQITRTDVWKTAGYSHRREFEGWQRGEAKPGSAVDIAIRRVLREKPHLGAKK